MKVLLSGWEGSKCILPASSLQIQKYLPPDFDVYWLNYGLYTEALFAGTYVALDDEQHGGVNAWASYLIDYLKSLDDERVIFALDDYLLASRLDRVMYQKLLEHMTADVVCARLCVSDFYAPHEAETKGHLITLHDAEYSATTQYCIWNREFLVELLGQVRTPWEFETIGTVYLNMTGKKVIGTTKPALDYPVRSALSTSFKGINLEGLTEKDIKELYARSIL